MADTVHFIGGIGTPARPATVQVIFDAIRRHGSDNNELMWTVGKEREFDAIGGWFFDHLSLAALRRLELVTELLEKDLPGAIAHWNESRRPIFYQNFAAFRRDVADAIAYMMSHGLERPVKSTYEVPS